MRYKRWIKKCIIIALFGCVVYFSLNSIKQENKGETVAIINGENIYYQDCLNVKELNENLSDASIIEIVMKEFLVYQEAKKIGITVSDEEVEHRVKNLKNELPDMYGLCMEQYHSEKEYKQALYYSILYEKMFDYISDMYIRELKINETEIKNEMVKNGVAEEYNNIDNFAIYAYLKSKYRDEINDYFRRWNNDVYENAEKFIIDEIYI